ncbi:MAG: hypothetical protein JNN15_10960 [Blastocatellia bacterium]|nr:hypothetical protein [Blastocatellia bacterium]
MQNIEYQVTTMAGSAEKSIEGFTDGLAEKARFNRPNGLAIGKQGSIFAADFGNHAIRRISQIGEVTTIAGGRAGKLIDGPATLATFNNPRGLTFDSSGNLYVADFGNSRIRKISPELVVSSLAGTGTRGTSDGRALEAMFDELRDVTYHSGYIFAADRYRVRRVSLFGQVTTWAGGLESGLWDGQGVAARFGTLSAIAADLPGNIFVVDVDNVAIRYITPLQKVGTLAGADVIPPEGSNTFLQNPVGLAVDRDGNCWVTDLGDYTIKKITPKGVITQVAGSLVAGCQDGSALQASFQHPSGIAVADDGRIYVTDIERHTVRCIYPKQ